MKRRFEITYSGEVTVELDDAVIAAVDDEWRRVFYNLTTPEDIAEMVGLNLVDGAKLTHLDGWADLDDNMARIIDSDRYDVQVKEAAQHEDSCG